MRSLPERVRAFEQKKAKLAGVEAALKLAEKKSQLRRCIKIGEMAVKVGLGDLSEEALYGAMLALARESEAKHRQWGADGLKALAAQKQVAEDDLEPVVLTFAAALAPEVAAILRASGFRFNRLLQHWEGLARLEQATSLAESHGGVARAVLVSTS